MIPYLRYAIMQYSNMSQYNNGSNDNKNTCYTPLDAYRQQKHALQQQIAQVEALEKEMQEKLEQGAGRHTNRSLSSFIVPINVQITTVFLHCRQRVFIEKFIFSKIK